MKRLLPTSRRVPLHGVAASRRHETASLAGHVPHGLMRAAGAAVARLALAVAPHARRVWVVAGPGNNGGDGLEAAIHLFAAGRDVRVTLLQGHGRAPADAANALLRAADAGVPITRITADGSVPEAPADAEFDLVIDALLGIGVSRGPAGPLASLIDRVNGAGCPVLSIDTPSGLDVDSGQFVGDRCVLARHTLSLLTVKSGLFTGIGREQAGTVWFDPLTSIDGPRWRPTPPTGERASIDAATIRPIDAPVANANATTAADADARAGTGLSADADAWLTGEHDVIAGLPERSQALHKGSFGDVAVVGGGPGMTGAALLSARAAHASGAGKVFVDLLDDDGPSHDVVRPELMFRPGWHLGEDEAVKTAVVVCGCGAGAAAAAALPRLLELTRRLVLDADALNEIARDETLQARLANRLGRGLVTVMTPHPLEAARLAGLSTLELQADRLGSAKSLAERFRCVVVLKGSGTIVAAPGMLPHVNPTGDAALATGGTGDVLAGWTAGSWAQLPWRDMSAGLVSAVSGDAGRSTASGDEAATAPALTDAFRIAVGSVYIHGAAAESTDGCVMRAADLIDAMMRWKQARSKAADRR